LVEDSLFERFRDAFVEKTHLLKVGDPNDDNTDLGALISKDHLEKVLGFVALAEKEGGTVLTGGKKIPINGRCENGNFMEPTIVEGLGIDSRTNQEEIFGPVVTLVPFSSEEEAVSIANSTDYGLAATVWSSDLDKAHRVADRIDSGIVWINCWMVRDLRTPFGGMKNSGVGREGGDEALRFFTEQKNICVSY
jgi:aminomuconate-semialdehyde/2-hydroxymuconate-6-semialdehyde dehydrogenase